MNTFWKFEASTTKDKRPWIKISVQQFFENCSSNTEGVVLFSSFCLWSQRLQIFRRYSYLLYEIIYAIIFGVGAHLGVPGTLKVGQNFKISKFLSLVVVASNFQDVVIFAIWNYLCNIFGYRDPFGGPGTLKIGPSCQNFNLFVFGRSGFKSSGFVHIF